VLAVLIKSMLGYILVFKQEWGIVTEGSPVEKLGKAKQMTEERLKKLSASMRVYRQFQNEFDLKVENKGSNTMV